MTLVQASCVAIERRAILIIGPPGSGKSSVALALIDRGAKLVGDDGVKLEAFGAEALWAAPAPEIAGMLELRHVGIAQLEAIRARVCLAVGIEDDPPRFRESADVRQIEGVPIPFIPLPHFDYTTALRIEYALQTYGLALDAR